MISSWEYPPQMLVCTSWESGCRRFRTRRARSSRSRRRWPRWKANGSMWVLLLNAYTAERRDVSVCTSPEEREISQEQSWGLRFFNLRRDVHDICLDGHIDLILSLGWYLPIHSVSTNIIPWDSIVQHRVLTDIISGDSIGQNGVSTNIIPMDSIVQHRVLTDIIPPCRERENEWYCLALDTKLSNFAAVLKNATRYLAHGSFWCGKS